MMYRVIPALAAIALLSACQAGGTKDQTTPDKGKEAEAVDAVAAAPAHDSAATEKLPTSAQPDKGAAPDLSAYVGKYPFDKVSGVSWSQHPAVKAAIFKTVTDPAVRKVVLGPDGTAAPIIKKDNRLQAWVCESHNCGPHNWTVQLDPVSGAADVCYFDDRVSQDTARWFLANGQEEHRAGDCPAE